ncbi:MAG: TRL-like family protein [Oligoflexia bacterium]|nr:TRL-like family protein [Oligoflexia bacterium]
MTTRILAVLLAFVCAGCASIRSPLIGLAYTEVQAGHSVASNQAGNRVGEACATSILGLVAQGDASIETARRNGAITMITSVDDSFTTYVGVWSKYCTIVRGR